MHGPASFNPVVANLCVCQLASHPAGKAAKVGLLLGAL